MIKSLHGILAGLLFSAGGMARAAEAPMTDVVRDSLAVAAAQYTRLLAQMENRDGYPSSWSAGGLKTVPASDWTSGFFPGSLWLLYEATGEPRWRSAAEHYTAGLESQKDNRGTHDLGFMLYCSFGQGLRLTGNPHDREVLLTAAGSLSTRFNPRVGCIRSWDWGPWKFPVIIDNVMNLPLLLWAAKNGGASRFADIAVRHADITLQNHFRPDGSSWHLVDYDPASSRVIGRQTVQGAADGSAWARGQAWGLYGYTVMYRETRAPRYLARAQAIADFLMRHPRLPADKVPYWDFDAPGIPRAPRDASAAAIMSSALFQLAALSEPGTGAPYTQFAMDQLRSLAAPGYRGAVGGNGDFLLMHSTGNLPAGKDIDVPLNYADYYFLEALLGCRRALARPL